MIVFMELSFGGGSISTKSARLAFDGAQCVMGAERTMKHLKHIVRATMVTTDFLPLMRVSFFEWIFETTFETTHW